MATYAGYEFKKRDFIPLYGISKAIDINSIHHNSKKDGIKAELFMAYHCAWASAISLGIVKGIEALLN